MVYRDSDVVVYLNLSQKSDSPLSQFYVPKLVHKNIQVTFNACKRHEFPKALEQTFNSDYIYFFPRSYAKTRCNLSDSEKSSLSHLKNLSASFSIWTYKIFQVATEHLQNVLEFSLRLYLRLKDSSCQ